MSDDVYKILNDRDTGKLSISLGTSIAIESLCGLELEVGINPPLYSYELFLVNVRTLIRNCISAVESVNVERLTPEAIGVVIVEEWEIIKTTILKLHKINLVPYIPTYESQDRFYKNAILREPNTPKQKLHSVLESTTAINLIAGGFIDGLIHVDGKFQQSNSRTIILTHSPMDLLQVYQFGRLELLESHTGKVKTPSQWGTKLQGKDLHRIPFNKFTLQLFGDGYRFRPQPIVVRRAVLEVAAMCGWTPTTTIAKIKSDINKNVKKDDIKELLMSLATN